MIYLPLLPPEWRRGLEHALNSQISRAERAELLKGLSLGDLTNSASRRQVSSRHIAPATVALNIAETFINEVTNERWLDHAVLPEVVRNPSAITQLPYLKSTIEVLNSCGIYNADLAWKMTSLSFLSLLQTINNLEAALDLTITTRNWVTDRTIRVPQVPTKENIFQLAGERHVLTAGADLKNQPYWPSLAAKSGLTDKGRVSLRAAADLAGVTGEALRRKITNLDLNHTKFRCWPDGGVIHQLVNEANGSEATLRILHRLALEFAIEDEKQIQNHLNVANPNYQKDVATVRKQLWNLSDGTGFVRRVDAEYALEGTIGLSGTPLIDLIPNAALLDQLSDDYLYVQGSKSEPWIVHTSLRVLAEAEQLTVSRLRDALLRRWRGHKNYGMPPNVGVLTDFFRHHPDFSVEDGKVLALRYEPEPRDSLQSWILEKIRQAGGVAHRLTLMELAAVEDKNRSSVGLYIGLSGYMIRPVGQGCFASIGTTVSPLDIEIARKQARDLTVPTQEAKWSVTTEGITFTCKAGTSFVIQGSTSVKKSVRNLIADRRIVLNSSHGSHGHIAMSGSLLYGFSSAFQALQIMPGDDLTLSLNLIENTAFIEVDTEF